MTITNAPPAATELTWDAADPPVLPTPTALQWLRLVLRATTLVVMTYVLMLPLLILKALLPVWPQAPWLGVVRCWGRLNLWLCGLRLRSIGQPMAGPGALVSNHVGWIDIFTLLSADRTVFVSKAEVARWPVVGILSRQIGTVYIERKRSEARNQQNQLKEALTDATHHLCFFPEGTSTDGQRVLAFRSTLFAGFMDETLSSTIKIQPVSLVYRPSMRLPDAFYGWWGDMGLGGHLKSVLALSAGGEVDVVFHPAVRPTAFANRKALALHCEQAVREGVSARLKRCAAEDAQNRKGS